MELNEKQLGMQRVVCAALRKEGHLIIGPRHFDALMRTQINSWASRFLLEEHREEARQEWARAEQGFIDQWGNFLTRAEALVIATRQGQMIRRGLGGDDEKLFSENLY